MALSAPFSSDYVARALQEAPNIAGILGQEDIARSDDAKKCVKRPRSASAGMVLSGRGGDDAVVVATLLSQRLERVPPPKRRRLSSVSISSVASAGSLALATDVVDQLFGGSEPPVPAASLGSSLGGGTQWSVEAGVALLGSVAALDAPRSRQRSHSAPANIIGDGRGASMLAGAAASPVAEHALARFLSILPIL